jgi:hypothetical protein
MAVEAVLLVPEEVRRARLISSKHPQKPLANLTSDLSEVATL